MCERKAVRERERWKEAEKGKYDDGKKIEQN